MKDGVFAMIEKLSWKEICKRYPEQWIGLTDVEWKDKTHGEVAAAVVSITGLDWESLGNLWAEKRDFSPMFTFPDIVFDKSLEKNYKRLTYEEIQEKYPSQWATLAQVEWEPNNNATIKSAIVLYHGRPMGELTFMQTIVEGHLWSEYTTSDDGSFMSLGML